MECVESALKGSFRKEMTLKLNHQAVIDDLPAVGLTSLTADDFFVDDLLDFSEINAPDEEENQVVVVVDEKDETAKTCPEGLAGGEFGKEKAETCRNLVFKEGELSVPVRIFNAIFEKEWNGLEFDWGKLQADDVADLEWLSHFVDDSFPGYSLTCPAAPLPAKSSAHPPPPVETSVKPTRARSKRARNGVMGWSVSGSETSSSTSSSSSTSFSSSSTWLIYTNQPRHVDAVLESSAKQPTPSVTAAVKKRKTRPPREAAGGNGGPSAQPRRCSHCGVQKTPQWRAGPLGSKTLCNACGVRFKSGRLLPEYRPACSPTFSSELHSNHHRKVLEMRYKKELELPDAGSAPAVPSF